MKRHWRSALFALGIGAFTSSALAAEYHVEPLLINGPDSEKIVIAIIGDGYDIFSQEEFAAKVQSFIHDGIFPFDETYRNNSTAFNVYRIDAVSFDYGVSVRATWTDDEGNSVSSQPEDPYYSQDTVLGFIQTGNWSDCWMKRTSKTRPAIDEIMSKHLSRQPDYAVAILNVQEFSLEDGTTISRTFGGCSWGSMLAVTQKVSWKVVAHEWGHSVGGLRDEYVASSRKDKTYSGSITGVSNCSTEPDRNEISWASFVSPDPRMTLPTTWDSSWMDSNTTVGAFEGCGTYGHGIYRPVRSCRMNGNTPGFCPVCKSIFQSRVDPYLDQLADHFDYVGQPGARCRSTGETTATYTDDGSASNTTTGPLTFECPGLRRQNAGVFSNRATAKVTVVDRNADTDVCCALLGRQPNGTQVSSVEVCSAGAAAAPQLLTLSYPKLILNGANVVLDVECTVPPTIGGTASSIFDYQIGQQTF